MTDTDVSIIEFLRAHLDEDERVATYRGRLAGDVWEAIEVVGGRWEVVGAGGRGVIAQGLPQWEAEHIARHDPARVLAEVDAKRRILDECEYVIRDSTRRNTGDGLGLAETMLDLLALPYANRPGYRPEWGTP